MRGRLMALLRGGEKGALAVLMIGMALAYDLNILVREFVVDLSPRVAWIEEAALFALAWVVFLGLGAALERGRHITMAALRERLPVPLRRPVVLAINLTGFAFAVYAAKISLDLTLFVRASGQESPTLGVSMAWLYAAMPVGFSLLALRYLCEMLGLSNRFAVSGGHDY
jgi:C4-dicarboxylate transporter DctQ subunit